MNDQPHDPGLPDAESPELPEGDRLEAYWARAAADPRTPPPADLDPRLAALARELAAHHTAPPARPEFSAELGRRLAAQAAEQARARRARRPGSWAGLFARIPAPALRLALVALLAVVIVGGYLALNQPPPVSARELLERARAAQSPEAAGVQRFVLSATSRESLPQPGPAGETEIDVELRRWYRGAGLWRVESTRVLRDAQGNELQRQVALIVADGAALWQYDPVQKVVTIEALTGHEDATGSVAAYSLGFTDLASLLDEAQRCFDPVVAGRETVSGRAVYRVDLGPNLRCRVAGAPELGGRQVLWVDAETAFILKYERYLPDSRQVAESLLVTEVAYNVEVGAALTTFEPPAGARVVDNRPLPAPDPAELHRRLAQLAATADFPLLVPAGVPDGLAVRTPQLSPLAPGAWLLLLDYGAAGETGAGPGTPAALAIVEQRASDELVAQWTQGLERADVPGVDAWVRRGTPGPEGAGSLVVVRRGTTLAGLNSTRLTADELLRIAGTLEVVTP